jgi:hypothetical protein
MLETLNEKCEMLEKHNEKFECEKKSVNAT